MQRTKRMALIALVGGLVLAAQGDPVLAGSCCGSAKAAGMGTHASCSQQGSENGASVVPAGLHAGLVTATKANTFETVFSPDGVRVYRYTMQGNPRSTDEMSGTVEVQLPGGQKSKLEFQHRVPVRGDLAVWFCPMHGDVVRDAAGTCPKCGMNLVPQDYLFASIDLSAYAAHGPDAQGREVVGKIELKGLGDPEKHVNFIQREFPVVESITLAASQSGAEKAESGTGVPPQRRSQ